MLIRGVGVAGGGARNSLLPKIWLRNYSTRVRGGRSNARWQAMSSSSHTYSRSARTIQHRQGHSGNSSTNAPGAIKPRPLSFPMNVLSMAEYKQDRVQLYANHMAVAFILSSAVGFVTYTITQYKYVPVSDRYRVEWIPTSLRNAFCERADKAVIEQTQESWMPDMSPEHVLVETVVSKLLKRNNLVGEYKCHVVQDDNINAFVTQTGKIFVCTGLLQFVESEDELAFVLGHEIGHKLASHNIDTWTMNILIYGLISIFLDIESKILHNLVNFSIFLPFSRRHEMEADYIGLIIAARAGYDVLNARKFWERVAEASGDTRSDPALQKLKSYFSTHPSNVERFEVLHPQGPWVQEALYELRLYKEEEAKVAAIEAAAAKKAEEEAEMARRKQTSWIPLWNFFWGN